MSLPSVGEISRVISSSLLSRPTRRQINALTAQKFTHICEKFVLDTGNSDNICRLIHLFIPGSLRPVSGVPINVAGGTIPVIGVGTILCAIKDGDVNVHQLIIHSVLLAPGD